MGQLLDAGGGGSTPPPPAAKRRIRRARGRGRRAGSRARQHLSRAARASSSLQRSCLFQAATAACAPPLPRATRATPPPNNFGGHGGGGGEGGRGARGERRQGGAGAPAARPRARPRTAGRGAAGQSQRAPPSDFPPPRSAVRAPPLLRRALRIMDPPPTYPPSTSALARGGWPAQGATTTWARHLSGWAHPPRTLVQRRGPPPRALCSPPHPPHPHPTHARGTLRGGRHAPLGGEASRAHDWGQHARRACQACNRLRTVIGWAIGPSSDDLGCSWMIAGRVYHRMGSDWAFYVQLGCSDCQG